MKKALRLVTGILFATQVNAQQWTEMLHQPGKNFYEIRAAFNEYWKDKDITAKGKGYKQFKRWEYFMEQRVYPTGNLALVSNNWKNFTEFKNPVSASRSSMVSNIWTPVGPMGAMTGSATNGLPRKAGRDNFITFHPTNSSTFWVGAPAGGLWKTANGGSSWTTTTDNLAVIGCSDLAIDPTNSSVMYLATGDGDASDTYCIGVLKSTDGGLTWNTTGLTFNVSAQTIMRRLIINPSNPQIIIAATNIGIYRTTNGGTNWTQVNSVDTYDLEFKPGDPTTVYAAGTTFYRSTNSGASFTQINNGIPTSGSNRMAIAVTPADVNYVYVVASNNSTSGLLGVYRSVASGTAFTTVATSPDILANPCSSPSGGGQGWYDLAIAVSPLDKNEVVVGGVNVWRSINGGSNFSIIGCWNSTSNPPYIHSDQHELEYTSTGTLYSCNDGGTYYYNGSAWVDISNPRNIAQIYKIGLSALSPSLWITGHQDNGSNIYNGTTYNASMPGDGMDCFIDRTNNNNMFASYYSGNFQRSTNGGASWSAATTGLSGSGAWVSPWKQDPSTATRLYAGWSQMFVSNNLGASWTQLTATGGSGNIVEFAIAPSNNQVLYVIHGTTIRKTTNGGTSWTNVTGTIPVGSAAPSFITISPTDANRVWVTLSGYSSGNKVYQTTNGGTSWTNISSNLPNLPANCSVYQPSSNDQIYIGMDVGVYYKDNSTTSWTLYNNGLPNVPLSDMEISPAATGKLRAATYGRGVYEVDVVPSVGAVQSNFSFSGLACTNVSKVFTDNSNNNPTAWSWSVTPSSGVTINSSNSQNPSIMFSNPGIYTVSLIASNATGPAPVGNQTINVNASPALTLTGFNPVVCIGEDVKVTASGANSYTWLPLFLGGDTLYLNTSQAQIFTYTCNAMSSNSCSASQAFTVEVSECTALKDAANYKTDFIVYPNPANTKINIKAGSAKNQSVCLELFDVTGKLVLKQDIQFKRDKSELQVNISSVAAGVYSLRLTPEGGKAQLLKLAKE